MPHRIERPPYDSAAPGDTLGLRHVREALHDISFPCRTRELRALYGNWRIPITGVHFHRLAELLDGVPEKKFRSAEDVALWVSNKHPQLRE